MSARYTRIITRTCLKYTRRMLLMLATLMMVAVTAAADCERRTIFIGTILYGGRQFDTFLSCGSSAGNFAYTCAEYGGCYANPSIDADAACGCSNEQMLCQ
jgi:hypothetical protein